MASTTRIARGRRGALLLALISACTSGGTAPDPGTGGSTGQGATGGTAGSAGGGQSANGGGGAVPVVLPSCGDIPSCGGDPEGEWSVEGACLNVLKSFYTTPGCEDMLAEATADASGTYYFILGTFTYDLDLVVHQKLSVSDFCARASGFVSAREACPALEESYARNSGVDSVSCSLASGRCECALTFASQHFADGSTYEVRNDRLYPASGKPSDFCVTDDTMSLYLEEVSDPPEPGDTGILLSLGRN